MNSDLRCILESANTFGNTIIDTQSFESQSRCRCDNALGKIDVTYFSILFGSKIAMQFHSIFFRDKFIVDIGDVSTSPMIGRSINANSNIWFGKLYIEFMICIEDFIIASVFCIVSIRFISEIYNLRIHSIEYRSIASRNINIHCDISFIHQSKQFFIVSKHLNFIFMEMNTIRYFECFIFTDFKIFQIIRMIAIIYIG